MKMTYFYYPFAFNMYEYLSHTPTDYPKSTSNRCVFGVYGAVFVWSLNFLQFSVGLGAFGTGLCQISSCFHRRLDLNVKFKIRKSNELQTPWQQSRHDLYRPRFVRNNRSFWWRFCIANCFFYFLLV